MLHRLAGVRRPAAAASLVESPSQPHGRRGRPAWPVGPVGARAAVRVRRAISWVLLTGLAAGGVAAAVAQPPATPGPEGLVRVEVFRQRQEGYHTYRIPSLVPAADGTLIAIVEGRRDNSVDPGGGHIDLVYKLSRDGGRSWSAPKVFDRSPEGAGASNPTAVVDRGTGRIHVVFDRWQPGRGSRTSRAASLDNQVWIRTSDDHGATWSDARDLTAAARDVARWSYVGLGPGGGLCTKSGRLVIPAYGNEIVPGADQPRKEAFALWSDDHGQTWRRGAQLGVPTNENQLVELDDGRLLVDARQNGGTHRWVAESRDGGATWSPPRPGQTATRICTSILLYPRPGAAAGAPGVILWSGPRGTQRQDLVLRASRDLGQTFPAQRLIGPGPAAYSNLALLGQGDVGLLWEGGADSPYEKVIFTRIPAPAIEALAGEALAVPKAKDAAR